MKGLYKKIATILCILSILNLQYLNKQIAVYSTTAQTLQKVVGKQITIAKHKGTYTGWIKNNMANGYGTFTFKNGEYFFDFTGNWVNNKLVKQATETIYKVGTKVIRKGVFDANLNLQGYGTEEIYYDGELGISYSGGFKNGLYNGYGVRKYYLGDGKFEREDGTYKNGEFYGAKLMQTVDFEDGITLDIKGVYKEKEGIVVFLDVINNSDDDVMFNTSLCKMLANGYQYDWDLNQNFDFDDEYNTDLAEVYQEIYSGARKSLKVLFPYVNATCCDFVFNISYIRYKIENMRIMVH